MAKGKQKLDENDDLYKCHIMQRNWLLSVVFGGLPHWSVQWHASKPHLHIIRLCVKLYGNKPTKTIIFPIAISFGTSNIYNVPLKVYETAVPGLPSNTFTKHFQFK